MTDIYLNVDAMERDLPPDVFMDITPYVFQVVTDAPATSDQAGGRGLILRFDGELTVEQQQAVYERARMGANEATLRQRVVAALTANQNDINQSQTVADQALVLMDTTGTRTAAQLSSDVRNLAQGVRILALNDVNTKRELTAIIRLLVRRLEVVD